MISCPFPPNGQSRPVPTIVLAVCYTLELTTRDTATLQQHHKPIILTRRTRTTAPIPSAMAAPPDPIKPDPSVSAKKWKPTTAQNSGNSSHVSLLTPGQSSPLPAVTPFGAPSSGPSTGAPAAPSPFTKLAPAALFLPISRNAHDERKGHAEMFE